jgi:spore coat protein A, manganese oxidase
VGSLGVGATRRDVLKIGGLGVLGAAAVTGVPLDAGLRASSAGRLARRSRPEPFRTPFVQPPVLRPSRTTRGRDGRLVDHFTVTERAARAAILPGGPRTLVWGYDGRVPGPTIKVRHGRRAVLRVRNHLPMLHATLGQEGTTSTHLHGSASLPQYDGYASDMTPPGFYKDYRFPNVQGARTLWYHDHAAHHTNQNVYSGLFAQYHMHDAEEERLLPQGEFDRAVSVADALFAADGNLGYDNASESGLWGDVILVNGRPWPVMRVKRRVYRFRFLVGSISRSYRFALDTGDPVTVVATDGGLMPRARQVDQWRHGTAERYEVLIDFRRYRPGQRVVLRNLSNDNNVDFDNTDVAMAFDVTDAPFDRRDPTWNRIPDRLVASETMQLTEEMATRRRHLAFERKHGLWTINGRTWEDVINSDFEQLVADPGRGDVEVWEIENRSGGWFHPVHIHLVDFKVLSRNGRAPFDYERGPKDTVYVGEGETVRVIAKFGPHRGRYMVHCHNLVHEDHDMMHQFAVGWRPGQPDPNNPILADPPRPDPGVRPGR